MGGQENRAKLLATTGQFTKFDKNYIDTTATTMSPTKLKRDLNGSPLVFYASNVQVKPRMIESKVLGSKEFANLPDNFKSIFTKEDAKDQRMCVPIVGYGGHRKGVTAENFFAKSYRESSMYAVKNKRALRNSPDYYNTITHKQ